MPNRTRLDRVVAATGALLLALVAVRAVLTIDPYFDAMAYHLAFGGRLAGVCPQDGCYRLGDYMESAFQGYPKLFHYAQGLVWRVTGLAQAVDLVNVASLALFGAFLRRWFAVPLGWTLCALLAVPLVQIQATATLVDLPVNLAMAAFVMGALAFLREPGAFSWSRLALIAGCLAAAANGKPQLIGPAAVLGGSFALAAFWLLARGRPVGPIGPVAPLAAPGPLMPGRMAAEAGADDPATSPAAAEPTVGTGIAPRPALRRGRAFALLAALVLAVAAVTSAKAIHNAVEHGNPFYPVRLQLGPLALDGPADPKPGLDSMAPYWAGTPVPLRWLASVLEWGAYDQRETPWTYDQGYCASALEWQHCWKPAGRAFHMGGFFVPYVLALAGFVAWRSRGLAPRDRRIVLGVLAAVTLATCAMPRSHELRYYMFWMIVLVSTALALAFAPGLAGRPRRAARGRALLGAVLLASVASVAAMSHGRYLSPVGDDARALVKRMGIDQRIARVPDGSVVCVHPDWQPFTVFFAPAFHPGRRYEARDGRVGGPDGKGSDCSVWIASPRDVTITDGADDDD